MGLRPSLASLHRRNPKEGRDALSEPSPSIPWLDLLSQILPAHLHTPSLAKSSPRSTSPQAASKASPQAGSAWQSPAEPGTRVDVPFGRYLSETESAGWPRGVTAREPDLLGFLGTERVGQDQTSTVKTALT